MLSWNFNFMYMNIKLYMQCIYAKICSDKAQEGKTIFKAKSFWKFLILFSQNI